MNRHSSAGQSEEAALTGEPVGDHQASPPASLNVTIFRCVGSSRYPKEEAPGSKPLWSLPVHEVVIPCAGRLQPEHLLKAFEAGADAVCVVMCAGDECRYLEGSRRADRRAEYVKGLLDEIGLGGQRLLVLQLAASAPNRAQNRNGQESPAQISELIVAELATLESNPLRQNKVSV
jgi:coenzyme F420-reducing hydrogenase delta subunit